MKFKSIRVLERYRHVILTAPEFLHLVPDEGNTLKALLKDGGNFSARFGGFIQADNVIGLKKVKLPDVVALCTDPEGQCYDSELPKNHYTVGTYLNGQLYVLLYGGKPKHFKLDVPDEPKPVNVVVDIFKNRTQ